jgi:hypothetical protein
MSPSQSKIPYTVLWCKILTEFTPIFNANKALAGFLIAVDYVGSK